MPAIISQEYCTFVLADKARERFATDDGITTVPLMAKRFPSARAAVAWLASVVPYVTPLAPVGIVIIAREVV